MIDIAGTGEQKLAAIGCHRSQRHLQPSSESAVQAIVRAPEQFHRAYPKWEELAVEAELLHTSSRAQVGPTLSIPVLR